MKRIARENERRREGAKERTNKVRVQIEWGGNGKERVKIKYFYK